MTILGKSLIAGFRFVSQSKVVSGLILGMLGAFFAAGAVFGLARTYAGDLNAGDSAYGILFAAVFTGLPLELGLDQRYSDNFLDDESLDSR